MRIRAHFPAILGLLAGLFCGAAAQAQPLIGPELPVPGETYVTELHGPVEWTFPKEMRRRVEPLWESFDTRWAELTGDFGIVTDRDLIVRVARNPEEMAALAPIGYPPPTYATGVAYPQWGLILLTLSSPGSWYPPDLEVVFTHELSHVALYRAVGGQQMPRWFIEGVAIHQSEVRLLPRMQSLLRAAVQQSVIPLPELNERFPERPHEVNLAYAQSADLIGFMRENDDDAKRFQRLVVGVRRGEPFEEALAAAYGWTISGLERQWRDSLRTRYRVAPFLLGGTTIWSLAAVLMFLAYRRRRKQHRAKLDKMEKQEALEAATLAPEPTPEVDSATNVVDEGGVPVVEHDGESHTLH